MNTRIIRGTAIMMLLMIPAGFAFILPASNEFHTLVLLAWVCVVGSVGGHAAMTPRNAALSTLYWFALQFVPYVVGAYFWDLLPLKRVLGTLSPTLSLATVIDLYLETHTLPLGPYAVAEGRMFVLITTPVLVFAIALAGAVMGGMYAKNTVHRGRYWE